MLYYFRLHSDFPELNSADAPQHSSSIVRGSSVGLSSSDADTDRERFMASQRKKGHWNFQVALSGHGRGVTCCFGLIKGDWASFN